MPWFTGLGAWLIRAARTAQGLGAFTLIALGVMVTKFHSARHVIRPLVCARILEAGVRLLPMVTFVGTAMGLLIIGQTVSLLNKVGAQDYTGLIMVTVVIRELGPLTIAMLVLAEVGTSTVIELGNARAFGEIEGLEAIGIDPIHYLVVPRILGLAVSVFTLTVYLIFVALLSGYLFAFLHDIALRPSHYFGQIAASLGWEDFALLTLKTMIFGGVIGVTTCYQGLANRLRLDQVSLAATRAVVHTLVACVSVDALFIIVYLAT